MVEVVPGILPDDEAAQVDPLGFVPEWASRVSGLGGGTPPPDENYVFHTRYEDFGEGEVSITAEFQGLTATRGSLVLRVNAYPTRPGSVAYQALYTEVPMRLVMLDGGQTRVRFLPLPDTFYAILGHIYDETDAAAQGMTMTAQRASAVEARVEERTSARRTTFEAPAIRASARLTAGEPPRLAEPVSQMSTAAQFAEPAYAEWASRLKEPPGRDPAQWQSVYILQALRRYGMLEPGARGLGFGTDSRALPAVMAAIGCRIEIAAPAGTVAEGPAPWRRPDIVDDAVFDGHVALRPVDRTAALPDDLTGFDFLWAGADNRDLGTVAAVADFALRALDCLKPGGVAVYVAAIDPSGEAREADGNPLFLRMAFDRLALTLIGHGNEVAQLNHQGVVDPGPALFGLIVRRSLRS